MLSVPSMAIETDGEGFLIFAADSMSEDALIEYLYEQAFDWFENKYAIILSDDHKAAIQNRYTPQTVRRGLAKFAASATS